MVPGLDLSPIETERLLLRRPLPSDLPAVVHIHGDPETNRFNPRGPWSPEGCREMLAGWLRHWDRRGFGYWGVALRGTSELVGFGGLMWKDVGGAEALNLYFRFTPAAWGRGYATELGLAALRAAFGPLDEDRVLALVRSANRPSRRTLERLGLTLRREIQAEPGQPPSLLYAIDRAQALPVP